MAILVASFHTNLFIAELTERTIGHSRIETALEIRRETRKRFVAELTPAAEIFRAIVVVKSHVEQHWGSGCLPRGASARFAASL